MSEASGLYRQERNRKSRRFQAIFVRRVLLVAFLACIGCAAQTSSPSPAEVTRLLEPKVRSIFSIPPQMKVIVSPLRPSEIPGYDALTVTFGEAENKRDFDFLLAKDNKTLLRVFHIDLNKDPYADVMKSIDVSGRPTRGAKDAKVVAVTYDDFQCPFCARMHAFLFPTLLEEYGDRILFIYKDFPLEDIHPWALHAAVNANCLAAQNIDGYWDFADYVHGHQKEINTAKGSSMQNAALDKLATAQGTKHNLDATRLQACIKTQDTTAVRVSQVEGQKLGLVATPQTFVNGRKIDGALPIEDLRAAFDNALRDAGVAPPEHKPAAASTN
jgi:protein-disulfide isomerase